MLSLYWKLSMITEQYFFDRDIAPSTSRYEKKKKDDGLYYSFIPIKYLNNLIQLISVDLCASERALKALRFAFRGVWIALVGATRFVFNIYKRFMIV